MRRSMLWILGVAASTVLGCGGGTSDPNDSNPAVTDPGNAQTPPIGRANIEPWLSQGFYKSWHCEPGPHPPRPFGIHGQNRVCSNDLLSAAGPGEFPVGSASVKEVYSGGNVVGYTVSRHTSAGTTGSTWYWYERVGSGSAFDGQGLGVCVGCHQAAGSDASRSGHDFVYTQVR